MEKATEHNVQWKTLKIGDCCSSELGKTLDECRNTGKYRPYLCALNVLWGKIDTTIIKQMRIEDEELNRYLVKKGDLLVCEGGEIGRCAIWDSDDEIYYQNALHRVRFYDDYDSIFFMYLLCYYNDLNLIEKFGKGLTIKHLNQASFRSIPVSVPSLPVQRRIAAILSSADKEIEQTRQLISKYKSIKQGMMEDLLKPKEGWKKVKLGKVCEPSSEKYNPLTESLYQYCIEMENINQESGTINGKSDITKLLSLKTKFHKGEVLYGKLRPYLRKYWLADFDGACSTEIWVLKSAENIDNRFLFYLFQSEFINRIANLSSGTKMPRADWKLMATQEVSIPYKDNKPDFNEQHRIAKILSGIDRKMEAEEKVLEKYEKIKKGLMERLLKE